MVLLIVIFLLEQETQKSVLLLSEQLETIFLHLGLGYQQIGLSLLGILHIITPLLRPSTETHIVDTWQFLLLLLGMEYMWWIKTTEKHFLVELPIISFLGLVDLESATLTIIVLYIIIDRKYRYWLLQSVFQWKDSDFDRSLFLFLVHVYNSFRKKFWFFS